MYDYYYADGLLVRQTWGSNYIDFLYDESGLFSFVYNGTQYYYIKNLQGDVVAIANSNGTILVEYSYDAWGDVISITGIEATTLGAINPIRYRGYYFDTDTEFYYLNSRYYDPEIRRFINADIYISTGDGFIGCNMYAYCLNNPVMYADYTGESATYALQSWITTMWWLTVVDGFLPVGDIVYVTVLAILATVVAIKAIRNISSFIPIVSSPSQSIDWNAGDKNHIRKGTGKTHIPGWKRFGIDPNNNNSWNQILPIIKETVDMADDVTEEILKNGDKITYYSKLYLNEGVKVVVKIWTSIDGAIQKLSDAIPYIIN